jgi:hypothetical protein
MQAATRYKYVYVPGERTQHNKNTCHNRILGIDSGRLNQKVKNYHPEGRRSVERPRRRWEVNIW